MKPPPQASAGILKVSGGKNIPSDHVPRFIVLVTVLAPHSKLLTALSSNKGATKARGVGAVK
jgi:hypothetical protein